LEQTEQYNRALKIAKMEWKLGQRQDLWSFGLPVIINLGEKGKALGIIVKQTYEGKTFEPGNTYRTAEIRRLRRIFKGEELKNELVGCQSYELGPCHGKQNSLNL